MSTLIGSLLVLAVLVSIVTYMIRQKRKGKSATCASCSGGCPHAKACGKSE